MYFVSSNSHYQTEKEDEEKIGRKWEKTQKSFQSVSFLRRQILQNRSEELLVKNKDSKVTNFSSWYISKREWSKKENKGRKMGSETWIGKEEEKKDAKFVSTFMFCIVTSEPIFLPCWCTLIILSFSNYWFCLLLFPLVLNFFLNQGEWTLRRRDSDWEWEEEYSREIRIHTFFIHFIILFLHVKKHPCSRFLSLISFRCQVENTASS